MSRYTGNGGVRAFSSLYRRLERGARKQVCDGVADTTEEIFDELESAVRARDIKQIDMLTENLKFLDGASVSCRLPGRD